MKRLMIMTALLAAFAAHAQTPTYTLTDVAQHATAANCWMVLNTSKVYDFTPFISMHPGGDTMNAFCGKDGTLAFAGPPAPGTTHRHSSNAVALEAPYFIGNLATAPLPISVSIAPTNATTTVGGTVQFTPKVANSTTGVAWTLTPPTIGSISASGLFTAVTVGSGTITATSQQDTTKSASASVTVSTTPTPTPNMIAVAINPSALTLNQGARMRFRATLTNSTGGVTWSTTGSIGAINNRGMFVAGLTAGTGTVKATSVDDPTKSASAQVTITTVSCGPGTSPPAKNDD
jgi:Cytochrome b5-like Heme/Steroid binding domain/Bacterial Ig-like domain (group 2)